MLHLSRISSNPQIDISWMDADLYISIYPHFLHHFCCWFSTSSFLSYGLKLIEQNESCDPDVPAPFEGHPAFDTLLSYSSKIRHMALLSINTLYYWSSFMAEMM